MMTNYVYSEEISDFTIYFWMPFKEGPLIKQIKH